MDAVEAALPLVVALPGIAGALALTDARDLPIAMAVGSVVGLGYSVVVLWSTILILLHAFHPIPLFGGLLVITVALGVFSWKRRRLAEAVSGWREEIRTERWPLIIGGGAVLIFAVASVRGLSPALNFGVVNPFRYWADGVEVAAAGGVPDATLQWGSLYQPAVSKLGFSGFAGTIDFLGDDPLSGMAIGVIVGSIGLVLAAWSFGRALGLRLTAPLVAILSGSTIFVLKKTLVIRLNSFSADGFAALAAVTGAGFAIHAIRTKQRGALPAAAVAFSAAALTHLIPTLVALSLVLAYAGVAFLFERKIGIVLPAAAACVAAVAVAFGGIALGGGGDVGLEAVEGDTAIDTQAGSFDPTWYLASGDPGPTPDRSPEAREAANDGWYTTPQGVLRSFLGDPGTGTLFSILLIVAVGAVAIVLSFVAPRSLKPIPAAAFLVWLGILVAGLAFNRVYETYVPAGFPQRRLFSFVAFPLILIALVIAEQLLETLQRKDVRATIVATGIVTIVALVVSFPRPVFKPKVKNARHALAMFNWVNAHVPCDARIFANQRTAGIFQSLTGRAAVSEGMAPYLRPQMLNEVVDLLLEGRAFLGEPGLNDDFLDRYDIDYVVVSKDEGLLDRTPPLLGLTDEGSLQVHDGLELLRDEPRYAVYEVVQSDDERTSPPTDDAAGYECRDEALSL